MTTYPPEIPTVNAGAITVDQMLRSPLRVERRLNNLVLERLVSGYVFADGAPAPGGAVIYDRILENDLYTDRDVQVIEPGSEFPIVDDGEVSPEVAATVKRGGAALVTYEAKRRNQWDAVNRKLTRLANTIVRKIDTVAMAVLAADTGVPSVTGTDWSNAATRDPIGDVAAGQAAVDNLDLGYSVDTALVNPTQVQELYANKDIRDALPKENAATNPLLQGRINGLMGLKWVPSNRVPLGTVILLQSKVVGSLHDELPFYSRVIDQPDKERYLIQAARVCVPVITDPKAAIRLTGL